MKLELVHSFDVSVDFYEKNINHPMLLKMCEGRLPYLKSRTLVETTDPTPNTRKWRFRVEADYKLPEAAKKVIGEKLGWFEESVLHKAEHKIDFQVIPDVFRDRYKCGGDQIFVDTGPNTMDRVMTVEMSVGILIVGRVVEGHILDRLKETYAIEYEIQKEFFAKLKAGG
jgi:hypothetical protein